MTHNSFNSQGLTTGKEKTMKLKEFLTEYSAYAKAEKEIVEWVEKTYPGLTMDFNGPVAEIVRMDESIDYSEEEVPKIVEVVNIKIDEILAKHQEEIYIGEKLTLIWKKHPTFNPDVESIEDLKKNPKFLKYFKELNPRRKKKGGLHGKHKR